MKLKKLKSFQAILIIVAIFLIIIGILNEETKIVLTKAIYICLECIGIG
jgi:hypothetical membrane protein